MSSEDFFNSSGNVSGAQTAELKARKTRAPPPPPPGVSPAAAPAPSASSSYYGSAAASRPSSATSSRPSRATPAPRKSQPPRRAPPAAAAPTARPPAPTFYGTGGYSASSTSNPSALGGSSYYGVPAPVPVVPAPSPFVPSTTESIKVSNDGLWYSAPAAVTPASNDGWYSGDVQQPAAALAQPAVNPAYTSFAPTKTLHSSEMLAGAMDGAAQRHTFVPTPLATMQSSPMDDEDEPPLLQELGIHMDHIFIKTRAVVLPFSRFGHHEQDVIHDDSDDLAGPLAFALLLGGELLLTGKLQFGYIYGFGLFGCLAMTLVLNLMSPADAISVWTVASILGYALLPVNLLAVIKILVVNLAKLEMLGRLLAVLTITWCTVASTRLLEQKCDMRDQRYLVAYPIALLYSAFVMITIF